MYRLDAALASQVKVASWIRYALSVVLSSGMVLRWPDLFLFSKIVHLPDWVEPFPDPLFAAWLLLLGPIALALPGSPGFGDAVRRIAALAFVGPGFGAVMQSLLLDVGGAGMAAQVIWVTAVCAFPPAMALSLVAAIRARRAGGFSRR